MVTGCKPGRFQAFKKSVRAYCAQTYAKTELVIVPDLSPPEDRKKYLAFVKSLGRRDIRWVYVATKVTLGALKNRAVDAAKGSIVCFWDDDDIHHPERVELEHRVLEEMNYEAVGLLMVYQLTVRTRELRMLNFDVLQCFPGTLMIRKRIIPKFPETTKYAKSGENIVFLERVLKRTELASVAGLPFLFVYCFHGTNTLGIDLRRHMIREMSVSRAYLLKHKDEIIADIGKMKLPKGPIRVCDGKRMIFEVSA